MIAVLWNSFRIAGGNEFPTDRMKSPRRRHKAEKMKTSMEAKAFAIALVLSEEPSTWGKAEADKASAILQKMLKDNEIDANTFAQAVGECCGNHSAMRQVLEKHGLLAGNAAKPAWVAECEKQLEAITSKPAKIE